MTRRIAELRESRLPGLQTIEEFMARRFTPAVATCHTASQRLHGLSERVARASHLLSTRVDIARERQNQALLASMNRRARLQLRLQQTVEGLSVAAIVYYMAGLVGYVGQGPEGRRLEIRARPARRHRRAGAGGAGDPGGAPGAPACRRGCRALNVPSRRAPARAGGRPTARRWSNRARLRTAT